MKIKSLFIQLLTIGLVKTWRKSLYQKRLKKRISLQQRFLKLRFGNYGIKAS